MHPRVPGRRKLHIKEGNILNNWNEWKEIINIYMETKGAVRTKANNNMLLYIINEDAMELYNI